MIGRIRLTMFAGLAAILASFALVTVAEAQQASGRFRVMVPRLLPQGNADDDFGEDLAEDLRDLIDDFDTHQPVDEDEIEDAMDQFDMDWEDMNCIRSTQLASQINSEVVLCGSYTEESRNQYAVNARFVVVATNESFDVDPITVMERDRQQAAQHIVSAFDLVVQQTRAAAFCQDYFGSQQWESAITNCTRAVELNPESVQPHFILSRVYENTDRLEDAMDELEQVLELDPIHENALQWAGNISARLDRNDQAREYYERYLELNPQDSAVRMRIAYELAQAGDPVGAMQLIEQGFDLDSDNPNLYEQYGNFAFTAATQANQNSGQTGGAGSELPPEVADHYRTAIDAYERVFELRGDSTQATQLRNVVAAQLQLGNTQEAISFAEEALAVVDDNPRLWSIYADALNRAGQVDEAIAALDTVREIDPDYQNVSIRQGQWLLNAGRYDEALAILQDAVERGEQPADVVARLFLAEGSQNGVQQEDWDLALEVIPLGKEFDVSEQVRAELDFWHGYSLFQQGIGDQEASTLESAQATLPRFQQALELFQASAPYANNNPSIPLDQFVGNVETYIQIQEAIIQRESR